MPPAATKSKKAIFSFKVKVKVTRSLILMSFERASLVEYAAKYEVSICYGSRVIAKVKVDNRQTNRQDKNNMPLIIRSGGIKIQSKEERSSFMTLTISLIFFLLQIFIVDGPSDITWSQGHYYNCKVMAIDSLYTKSKAGLTWKTYRRS